MVVPKLDSLNILEIIMLEMIGYYHVFKLMMCKAVDFEKFTECQNIKFSAKNGARET